MSKLIDIGIMKTKKEPTALESTQITPEIIASLHMPWSYVGNRILLLTGKNPEGKQVAYATGEIPKFDKVTVKKLYNSGWSIRNLSLLYQCSTGVIQNIIKS